MDYKNVLFSPIFKIWEYRDGIFVDDREIWLVHTNDTEYATEIINTAPCNHFSHIVKEVLDEETKI